MLFEVLQNILKSKYTYEGCSTYNSQPNIFYLPNYSRFVWPICFFLRKRGTVSISFNSKSNAKMGIPCCTCTLYILCRRWVWMESYNILYTDTQHTHNIIYKTTKLKEKRNKENKKLPVLDPDTRNVRNILQIISNEPNKESNPISRSCIEFEFCVLKKNKLH